MLRGNYDRIQQLHFKTTKVENISRQLILLFPERSFRDLKYKSWCRSAEAPVSCTSACTSHTHTFMESCLNILSLVLLYDPSLVTHCSIPLCVIAHNTIAVWHLLNPILMCFGSMTIFNLCTMRTEILNSCSGTSFVGEKYEIY